MKTNVLKNIGSSISKAAGRTGLQIQKYSPQLLLAGGLISIGGTIFFACKATLHAEEVLDRHHQRMVEAKEAAKVAEPEDNYDISKEKTAVYVHTVVDMAKLYAPAVALGTLSVGMILASYNILNKRYLGVMAAYNAVSGAFETYRSRVKEELGEDMDRHFRYGTKKEKITVEEVDETTGKTKKIKKDAEILDGPLQPSMYARYFDSSNRNWDKNPEFSLMFLRGQQNIANDILKTRGHIFLNEVYDMLGYDHTQIGSVTGWVLGEGDDYVDFGICDSHNPEVRRFINGKDNIILLDFNVDGVIWDKI